METTLHKQLKQALAQRHSQFEQTVGNYRIDVVTGQRLIEIQSSGLSSIGSKVRALLHDYKVDVVKPLVHRKRLIRLESREGAAVHSRWSNYRGSKLDVFAELVYFVQLFPHPKFRLIVPLIDIEETRHPGHGRRRRWRRNDFEVADRRILQMLDCDVYQRAGDLLRLLPASLPSEWDTKALASALDIPRSQAQQMAYVLRKTGAVEVIGKSRNAWLYRAIVSKKKSRSHSGIKTGAWDC